MEKQSCFFKHNLQFFMAIPTLPVELSRKTNNDYIAPKYGFADFRLPILPWLEFFSVQPGTYPSFDDALIESVNGCLVMMCMAKENFEILFQWQYVFVQYENAVS